MKPNILEKIKKSLLDELDKIKKQISELQADDPFNDPEHVNNNAAVDHDVREQETHQRIEAEIDTIKERQQDIRIALQRIEKGRYGYCKRCNTKIPYARLELIPETIYCVKCESEIKT
ncbi:hypothetical protein A3A93_03635 [Candidatus Roizmanbacteria bacterium RIFCSPLOWO2_01_FULL_38_12]|uniref:Zinc finger DksA/TraR C4-type domain-containing protein n=1 Tax=Candidatus Roizmanbacteria bacterium RIFCSPLOWO2_01_FULL_38_12 TaxID=1802061 RepID=A0A1F7IYV9_9BACT|nr:MAG: hypothetical protein A3F59_02220 [Candidatus Roizmanbacteria bacterium RIFCSPHIGHO2_12_FULL_38_13]OGK48527.1 MAG: hypothetical protein A3A93_03635 [Candidatus Roizmanbacteria bacterium RIFCSPLOWO2_01_FULL_38_12]